MPNAPKGNEGPVRLSFTDAEAATRQVMSQADIRVEIGKSALEQIVADRKLALTRVHETLRGITADLKEFFPRVPVVLPTQVQGQLLNPDGTPAQRVAVIAEEPQYGTDEAHALIVWPSPRTVTDDRGVFSLRLPTVPVPRTGLRLKVQGAGAETEVALRRADLLSERLGVLPLDRVLKPLPVSVISRLKAIVPTSDSDVEENPRDFADPTPVVTLAEGDCARSFQSNTGIIDKFGYSVLIRLVEPQVMPKQLVVHARTAENRMTPLPITHLENSALGHLDPNLAVSYMAGLGGLHFADRVPIDRPIDVTAFHNTVERMPRLVPKAASLGLGYIVKFHQIWIPTGMSLGDMLYSLPLAPGEQQRVAVHEQVETLSVREAESLSASELQSFSETADATTVGIFNSAFREAASGGSSMHTAADSSSFGGAAGIGGFFGVLFGVGVGGGYGSSSSSGSSSSWQQGSRDYVSSAVQDFHSHLGRTAAASRRSARTGVRLATASDREQLTTKVIANHNHCHALTMQYWQVLRHYAVSSSVDDVQLVCFVPLEIVQFLPGGQPATLEGAEGKAYTRDDLLGRYAMLVRYHDVIAAQLARHPEHRYGLRLLMNFAADPTAKVQSAGALNEDQITFKVSGTFLPNEDLYVTLVTRSGARVGPAKLIGTSAPIAQETYVSQDDLLQALRTRRAADTGETRTAELSLPSWIARSDVARFEISRSVHALTCRLKPSPAQWLPDSSGPFGLGGHWQPQQATTVTLGAGEVEQHLGGPWVWDAKATITGKGETLANLYSGRAAAEQMGSLLPIPALRVPPVLTFSDLLRIEALFQHVVQNTVTYSKAVWIALTPEERAILLERFTIGVPTGGIPDASQEVPLLNCVANQVLAYFGNCAVMPFQIPPPLAASMSITSRDVQEALLKFHRQAFVPPRSSITLPARGMLGEAVLGTCTACEKIDITRFWNWQDSPGDEATQPVQAAELFRGQSLIGSGGAQAPSNLTGAGNTSLITIGTSGVQQPANLMEALIKQGPSAAPFANLTGLDTLQKQTEATLKSANDARKEAMDTGKEMASKVIDQLPEVMKAAGDAKAASDTKSAEAQKEGLEKLTGNAGKYIGATGAQGDQARADAYAKSIVQSIFGKKLPGAADLAPLFETFKIGATDDAPTQMGKLAWLKALGLPTP